MKNFIPRILLCIVCGLSVGAWAVPPRGNIPNMEPIIGDTTLHARKSTAMTQQAMPVNITPRGLVILIAYQDIPFSTPRDTIDSLLNGSNFTRRYDYTYDGEDYHITSSGSARQYFEACSYGQYSPQFDVVGPVTADKDMKNYDDSNAQLLLKEAVEKAHELGVDFSRYDNDDDGMVDFVYMMYSGYAESDGAERSTIWPHAGYLTKYDVNLDGKHIYRYACGSELNYLNDRYYGIGMFCHEFSHVLGLKDLYEANTNYFTIKTLGAWDIMDQGCYNNDANTPPLFSACERFFLGWLQPQILREPANVTLPNLGETNQAMLISPSGTHNMVGNDPDPACFYILENRQQRGWDSALPGHGMLLSRIEYDYDIWHNNRINTADNQRVDLIEADCIIDVEPYEDDWYGKPGDCFPAGATEYTAINNYPITAIKETDGVITFRFMGGISPTTDVPADASNIGANAHKTLRDGQLFILRNGVRYNALGMAIK